MTRRNWFVYLCFEMRFWPRKMYASYMRLAGNQRCNLSVYLVARHFLAVDCYARLAPYIVRNVFRLRGKINLHFGWHEAVSMFHKSRSERNLFR